MSIPQAPGLSFFSEGDGTESTAPRAPGGAAGPLAWAGGRVGVAARRRDRPGGQLRSHLLRGRRRPPQCLFTNPALRARETRLLFQARGSRCQPRRRGRRGRGLGPGDRPVGRGQRVACPLPLPHLRFCPRSNSRARARGPIPPPPATSRDTPSRTRTVVTTVSMLLERVKE